MLDRCSRTCSRLTPLLAAVASLIAACASPPADTGGVDVNVTLLSAADVVAVSVTITNVDDSSWSQVAPLAKIGPTTWKATVGSLPAKGGYFFKAVAKDGSGNTLYEGINADAIKITKDETTTVLLSAQQKTPPLPFKNIMPVIDAFVASANTLAPGDGIFLVANAHDPNPGDTLAFSWSASPELGTFSSSTSEATTWTAPSSDCDVTITIAVTDNRGATISASLVVHVRAGSGRGDAKVTVSLNTWPQIGTMTAVPGFITPGQPISLSAVASDADGDPMTYAWTSTCSGTFGGTSAATTTFLLPTGASATSCDFDVSAADNRGGSTHGQLTIPVGVPATLADPVITFTSQSAASIGPGGTVTFAVAAVDPQSSTLTFTWQTSGGLLSGQTDTTGSSLVTWSAPTGGAGSHTISVLVSDSLGLHAQQDFAVAVTGP